MIDLFIAHSNFSSEDYLCWHNRYVNLWNVNWTELTVSVHFCYLSLYRIHFILRCHQAIVIIYRWITLYLLSLSEKRTACAHVCVIHFIEQFDSNVKWFSFIFFFNLIWYNIIYINMSMLKDIINSMNVIEHFVYCFYCY